MKQVITKDYALYNGDCIEVMRQLPDKSVDLSIYSPPFMGLYNYSSDERDLSNCASYEEFFEHYEFVVSEIARLTKPGRFTAVHCMDVPSSCNAGAYLTDFPGDIIKLHEKLGFKYVTRRCIWKEPLGVRLRTMSKGLAHRTICEDSTLVDSAGSDYLLEFRRTGNNETPVTHPTGLDYYAGGRSVPAELYPWRGWKGKQTENRFSHYIWRNYASSFWDDIRLTRVLPHKDNKDPEDERHVHPLQLDVIERVCVLRSNPGEVVLTPFMGVGSEVYGSVLNNRKALGIELKEVYFNQAVLNCEEAAKGREAEQETLFKESTPSDETMG